MTISQDLFDKIYLGIVYQGGPAISGDKRNCMYRTPSGRKCAAGQLIPDDKYNPSLENKVSIHEDVQPIFASIPGIDLKDLDRLQNIHDSHTQGNDDGRFFRGWLPTMDAFARSCGLTIPEIA